MLKNYIFDFGGVLYLIDQTRTIDEFRKLSAFPELFDNFEIKHFYHDEIFLDFEKGYVTSHDFRFSITHRFALDCTSDEFDLAWNSTLTGETEHAKQIIVEAKQKGKVILLSNTNVIHHSHFSRQCEDLFSLFDNLYFSFEMNQRKPDLEIFHSVIEDMCLKPDETLFFDDSPQNLAAAASIGIRTFLVHSGGLSNFPDIVS